MGHHPVGLLDTAGGRRCAEQSQDRSDDQSYHEEQTGDACSTVRRYCSIGALRGAHVEHLSYGYIRRPYRGRDSRTPRDGLLELRLLDGHLINLPEIGRYTA